MNRTSSSAEAAVLLARLVGVPSVNPRGAAPHDGAPGERGLADFLLAWCAERNIEATTHEALPGRPNVVAVVPGASPVTVLLEAHLDTVETTGMTVEPFAAEVRNGRLYGRGACDAKGSLAAYLLVLEEAARSAAPLPVTVMLAGVADEEHLYRGVVTLLETHSPDTVDYLGAIVGEPTEMVVGIAHKGVVRFTVHVEGRSGHSSRPDEAQSAVVMAMDVVARLEGATGSSATHPLLGGVTRTVVRIAGGEGPNVVPGHCEVDVDRRLLPGEDPLVVWREIGEELDSLHSGRITLDSPFVVDFALDTDPASAVADAVSRSLAAHGRDGTPAGLSFSSDASKTALAGIPSVVLGPGSIGQAHTKDEHVEIAEVVLARDVVLEALRSIRVDL